MKSHEQKKGKQMVIKKPNKKRRKDNKTLSKKNDKGAGKKT
jgi:hypothetical protein